jgi:hypothetical protein
MQPTKNAASKPKKAAKSRPRVSEHRATLDRADVARVRDAAIAAMTSTATALAAAADAPIMAPSTDLVAELNNIDFKTMIGGPLQAAVDAQIASSLATVDFINNVGFKTVDGARELVMVDFSHTRQEAGDPPPEPKKVVISVPLLAMLPIPSLRIEHVIIDFNVKLNSVESSSVSSSLGVDASVTGGWGPVNFKVSASYQRKTATNVEVKKEYALNVNVKAVQDEIPAGLEKILNLLAA